MWNKGNGHGSRCTSIHVYSRVYSRVEQLSETGTVILAVHEFTY